MNAQEIVQAVRDYTNRPNLTEFTIALWWRMTEGDVNRLIKHPRMIVRADLTLSTDQQEIACPSNLLQMRNLFIGGELVPQYDMTNYHLADGQGYVVRGSTIRFNQSLAAGTVVELDYYGAVPPLSGEAPVNWISDLFPDVYIFGALKQAAIYLKDNASLQTWNGLYAQVMEGLDLQGWGQELSDGARIRLDE